MFLRMNSNGLKSKLKLNCFELFFSVFKINFLIHPTHSRKKRKEQEIVAEKTSQIRCNTALIIHISAHKHIHPDTLRIHKSILWAFYAFHSQNFSVRFAFIFLVSISRNVLCPPLHFIHIRIILTSGEVYIHIEGKERREQA